MATSDWKVAYYSRTGAVVAWRETTKTTKWEYYLLDIADFKAFNIKIKGWQNYKWVTREEFKEGICPPLDTWRNGGRY